MKRLLLIVAAFAVGNLHLISQIPDDLNNVQFHGFATQAFLASNHNNYLGMDTRNGSGGWTEAALNINDQVSDKLRVGMQFHYTRLGAFGDDTVDLDWAQGDYHLNDYLGVRAGKVKIRWGLFNDIQDNDPGYMWSLLPESIYGIDIRATNLSQLGAELYGKIALGGDGGQLAYSAYYGSYNYATNDGYAAIYKEEGTDFVTPPHGKTPGFDLRWNTPVTGLAVGGSLMMYNATGTLVNGTYRQPTAYWPAYYAQFNKNKVSVSGQYSKYVEYDISSVTGSAPSTNSTDARGWFVMGGYHLTEKLQAGAYYTHYLNVAGGDNSDPANYYRDWVASGRYDLNTNFYLKLEGHFMHGNGVGFYDFNNPNGLVPATNLAVAKIGFMF